MSYQYPIYKQAKLYKLVLKFIDLTAAIVIKAGNSNYTIGSKETDWVEHTNSTHWQDYRPKPKYQIKL